MKKLILCCLLFPFLSQAQKSEIGFSAGTFASIDEIVNSGGDFIGGAHASLSYFHNYKHIQASAGLEFDYLWGTYVTPKLMLNYKFSNTHTYFYLGIQSGGSTVKIPGESTRVNIFFAGVQGGIVAPLGKHLSFNGELGVRRYYLKYISEIRSTLGEEEVQYVTPVSVGLRYSF